MNLLAIETSTEQLSLALLTNGTLNHVEQLVGNASSTFVLPKIQTLLDEAQIHLADLNGIAFGAGPGSFTGVRIAAGITQGLAFGLNLPVVSISTLLALAEASGESRVIACLDARMGEVYHAVYEKQGETWHTVIDAGVYKPEFVPKIAGEAWVGVGSGWKTYPEPLSVVYQGQVTEMQPNLMPTAAAVLALAKSIFEKGETNLASQAMPIYVRNRVAMTTIEREQAVKK